MRATPRRGRVPQHSLEQERDGSSETSLEELRVPRSAPTFRPIVPLVAGSRSPKRKSGQRNAGATRVDVAPGVDAGMNGQSCLADGRCPSFGRERDGLATGTRTPARSCHSMSAATSASDSPQARPMRWINHFVHDADDRMVANVAVRHVGGGVVSEDTEAVLHAGDILGRLIDQEIDVFRETARAVSHDREAADGARKTHRRRSGRGQMRMRSSGSGARAYTAASGSSTRRPRRSSRSDRHREAQDA